MNNSKTEHSIWNKVPIAISLAAIAIAFASFYRTTRLQRLQESDYMAALQMAGESINGQGFTKDDAFSYEADLENRGLKPVRMIPYTSTTAVRIPTTNAISTKSTGSAI